MNKGTIIMKKKSITRIALLLAMVLTIAGLCMLTGCAGDEVTDIYITKSDSPRLNYVEGQELDLSDGRLTIIVNGEEQSTLPLSSTEITVTGYDKAKIGQQTLTVAYGGLTTTITVNVAPRAVAEAFETKYFVGDTFNKSMGKIKITTDDIESFTVNMNDEKISLVSFDSSVAGPATVTVRYSDGQNSYDCQFSVTVYEESNIQFTAPSKTRYNSNDKGIDISGGFLKVTSSDSKLTKHVPLTEDMISGFDLAAATIENRKTPKEQKVTVEYLGKTFEYTVYITYSGISVVNYHAQNALATIDWNTVKETGLTKEQRAAALDAITEYYKLTEEQLPEISQEVLGVVVRSGVFAVSEAFQEELATYSKTFYANEEMNLFFACESYEQTVADLERLNDTEAAVHVYADLLRKLETQFGGAQLVEGVAIMDYIAVYTAEMQDALLQILNHLVGVYENIADIPADWNAESLKPYGDKLVAAAMQIYNSGYYRNGFGSYYTEVLSKWREKKDIFDIFFTYFVYDYENSREFVATYMFGSMPLPGKLEEWYRSLNNAVSYENFYANNATDKAFLYDVSPFMYHYMRTLELSQEIMNSGNQLWIDIYKLVDGDQINRRYMYTYTAGYLYHTKAMIDSAAYHQLWSSYYTVLKAYADGKLSATEDKEEIVAMYRAFEELGPSELLGFLSSMNLLYTSAKGAVYTLSYDNETVYNTFTLVLRDYYLTYLNEANKPLFANLLLAMENHALINYKDNARTEFNTIMQKLIADYNALSDADKANFNEYMGVGYNNYLAIYNMTAGGSTPKVTDAEKALLDEMNKTLGRYAKVYQHMLSLLQNEQEVSPDLYAVLHSQYAYALVLRNAILTTGSPDAIMAYYTQTYSLFEGTFTLEQAFHEADQISTSVMIGQNATLTDADGGVYQVTAWNLFADYGMAGTLAQMSEILYYAHFGDGMTLNKDNVVSVMGNVRGLNKLQNSIMSFFSADVAYYKALNTYFASVLSEGAVKADVAGMLMNAEKAYVAYVLNSENTEARDSFLALMEQLKAVFETLTAEDKTYLGEAYNHYLGLYETLKAPPAAA